MNLPTFIGNQRVAATLRRMVAERRLPQTLLFAGPRGVGKATLARQLAAAMNCPASHSGEPCGECSNCRRILKADLSSEAFQELFEERLKMPAAKRLENPLIVATHPDFLIFPPDGPLQMITIEQARRLTKAARFGPSEGVRRVFLVDNADRANEEAANSLLKTLEEPADSLTIILTAANPYELLPTIRSRSIPFYFGPLTQSEMRQFFDTRPEIGEQERERLAGWSDGSPGKALSLDAEEYTERRGTMLAILRTALGTGSFAELLAHTENVGRKRQQKLGLLVDSGQGLLRDLVHLKLGTQGLINEDLREELESMATRVTFDWVEKAAAELDELVRLERRNIQKQVALESLAVSLRHAAARSAHSA